VLVRQVEESGKGREMICPCCFGLNFKPEYIPAKIPSESSFYVNCPYCRDHRPVKAFQMVRWQKKPPAPPKDLAAALFTHDRKWWGLREAKERTRTRAVTPEERRRDPSV
jgi:hypothetical protein